jgi:hypothetical protein
VNAVITDKKQNLEIMCSYNLLSCPVEVPFQADGDNAVYFHSGTLNAPKSEE